jgi:FkbM family methyltransferase
MLDVGAYMGHTFKSFAVDGWSVYAFEPDPTSRGRLVEAWGAVPTVHIDERAVANRTADDVPFFRSDVSAGISGLTAFHVSHTMAGTVKTTTVDEFCRAEQITAIDYLKVDAEGFDLFVLHGVPWREIPPRVVVCEFEDAKTVPLGYAFDDLATYLVECGYHVLVSEWYPVVQYGGPHRWRRFAQYPSSLADQNAWGNLIAARDKTDFDRLVATSRSVSTIWRLSNPIRRLRRSNGSSAGVVAAGITKAIIKG